LVQLLSKDSGIGNTLKMTCIYHPIV